MADDFTPVNLDELNRAYGHIGPTKPDGVRRKLDQAAAIARRQGPFRTFAGRSVAPLLPTAGPEAVLQGANILAGPIPEGELETAGAVGGATLAQTLTPGAPFAAALGAGVGAGFGRLVREKRRAARGEETDPGSAIGTGAGTALGVAALGPAFRLGGAAGRFLGSFPPVRQAGRAIAASPVGTAVQQGAQRLAQTPFARSAIERTRQAATAIGESAILPAGRTIASRPPTTLLAGPQGVRSAINPRGRVPATRLSRLNPFGRRGAFAAPRRTTATGQALQRRFLRPFEQRLEGIKQREGQELTNLAASSLRIQAKFEQGVLIRTRSFQARAEELSRAIDEAALRGVKEVRPALQRHAAQMSDDYTALIEQGLAGKGDVRVPATKIMEQLRANLPDDPELIQATARELGIFSKELEVGGQRVTLESLQPHVAEELSIQMLAAKEFSLRELLTKSKSLRQQVSRAAKQSRRTFTPNELFADTVAKTVGDLAESNGITTLKPANTLWAQWAPIRDKSFTTFRPFLAGVGKGELEAQPGVAMIRGVAQGKRIGDEEFVAAVETRTGVPLTARLTGVLKDLKETERRAFMARLNDVMVRKGTQAKQTRAAQEVRTFFRGEQATIEQAQARGLERLGQQQLKRQLTASGAVGAVTNALVIGRWILLYRILFGLLRGVRGIDLSTSGGTSNQ